jgi:hypothetical protein
MNTSAHGADASQPSGEGPVAGFTGAVRIDAAFAAPEPARVAAAHVTFEPVLVPPGTRTRSARRSS